MDLSAVSSLGKITGTQQVNQLNALSGPGNITSIKDSLSQDRKVSGDMFGDILNTAIDNIKTTNSYLSDAENEEIKFALGETENTHDLTIALQKASTALQYTVAVRDKCLEAYKELMQMQI